MRAALVVLAGLAFLLMASCSPQSAPPPPPATKLITRSEPANPYPEADSVRLMINDLGLGADRQMHSSNPKGRRLTPEQRKAFEAAFTKLTVVQRPPPDPDAEVGYAAACFVPHHFFRYMDRDGRVIGEIAVCFCCTGARASPRLPFEGQPDVSLEVDIVAIKALVAGMGLPTEVGCAP